MAEAEEHGEVGGEMEEVPRLVGEGVLDASPGREADDDEQGG